MSLWGYAWVRQGLESHRQTALAAANEAVASFEQLAERSPAAFSANLNGARATQAVLTEQDVPAD